MKTVSLELSKELKLNGYPQEGYNFWSKHGEVFNPIFPPRLNKNTECVAPTADEILDLLPVRAKIKTAFNIEDWEEWDLSIEHFNSEWTVKYTCGGEGSEHVDVVQEESADTLADAAALMYLYLKKEGLL